MSISIIARVECRSEGASEERPVAVWFAHDRSEVAEILDDAVIGSAAAGGSAVRRLRVRLGDGQELVLHRVLPEGEWRVSRA